MNSHPYLRAYMAGIALPTFFMLFVLTAFIVARFVYNIPIPIERAIAFPMAVVPNLWGVWNILYAARHGRRWPLGLHGAVLPLLLMPAGLLLAKHLGIDFVTWTLAATFAPVGVAVYYLVWKYIVGFLNQTLGVA
jgi:hypothetical protein